MGNSTITAPYCNGHASQPDTGVVAPILPRPVKPPRNRSELHQKLYAGDCCVCEMSIAKGDAGLSYWDRYPICAFCATYFKPDQSWEPRPHRDLTEHELMGAWYKFSEDLQHFHCNFQPRYLKTQRRHAHLLPRALDYWVRGSLFDDDIQRRTVELMWQLEAYGAILTRVEPAMATVELFLHRWLPLCVKRAIERTDVEPVWSRWYAAQKDSSPDHWNNWGAHMWHACGGEGEERLPREPL